MHPFATSVTLGLAMLAGAAVGAGALNEIAGKQSRTYPGGYRTDVIDAPIHGHTGLHYVIRMKAGDTLVYSWEIPIISNPQSFYSQFHGHVEDAGGAERDMLYYETMTGSRASGSLIAPSQGRYGWVLNNNSDAPVMVRLHIAGFYELIPDQIEQPIRE
jgi:hypothetical protein